jgi:hypothetical protein
MSLFGVQQFENAFEDSTRGDGKASSAFDSVARVTEGQLSGQVREAYRAGDRLQSGVVNAMFGALPSGRGARQGAGGTSATGGAGQSPAQGTSGGGATQPNAPSQPNLPPYPPIYDAPSHPVNSGRLDTSSFVVLGEGLAAGMGDFTLSEETQRESFPAHMARQMGARLTQRLIQSPGICNPVGFAKLPVVVPTPMQTTVIERLPPEGVSDLCVPGYRISDALGLHLAQPLVQRHDAVQTAANLILGITPIAYGERGPLPTQLECALNLRPTFALVELGYHEALEAAVKSEPGMLPDARTLRSDYAHLVKSLRDAGSEVLALTIPDPFDTAHFSSVETAARILKVDSSFILDAYGLKPDDLVTPTGLMNIGFQLLSQNVEPLPEGCVVGGEAAGRISRRLAEINSELTSLAQGRGAFVYDLRALFRRVRDSGVVVGSRTLTAEYLGGFYSLNGYYPGATGHAFIANELLHALNTHYGSDFGQTDLRAVMGNDPVSDYRQAEGQTWDAAQLQRPAPPPPQQQRQNARGRQESESHESKRAAGTAAAHSRDRHGSDVWKPLGPPQGETSARLQLPPGLEQELPLSKAASYFGDSIRAVNCRDPREMQFGSCRGQLFGGFAMVDSHLSGTVRIRFTEPAGDVTHFEVTHGEGLAGDDGTLAAPQFFKLPALQNSVRDVPGLVSSGDLNLATGEVSNLTCYFTFFNTALGALASVNPNLPQTPIVFSSLPSTPTRYGSAWAAFEQRPDGLLDYTFYGSAFLPLGADLGGDPVKFPLPMASSSLQFASVPARGTALHPHISVSTKEPETAAHDSCPDIPFNTLQELTLFTHNSSFGDAFTLDAPDVLGGGATGRSQFLGRALLQFGERAGNTAPVAVSLLNAGGVLAEMAPTPITQAFPGRLYPGPHGCDEVLRFPLRSYSLDDLMVIDDPFDISVGAVDLTTGRFINDTLHRGFINQDLFFALIRVEPRTPQSSFFFRGPTALARGAGGRMVFRFKGQVHIPYPEGFLFPNPNLATGFVVGPDSALDPFLWIHAVQDGDSPHGSMQGGRRDVIASTGERFSYSYRIPSDPSRHGASFEYENHTQQGKFKMHSLAWVGFGNSGGAGHGAGEYDTVTFACFGVWSKDGSETVQQAAVQVSTSSKRPYVGIQVDIGNVSSVNTKPVLIQDAEP